VQYATAGARLETSATLLGDVTGDGIPELLAGAPGVGGLAEAGRPRMLSLTTGQTLRIFPGTARSGARRTAVAGVGMHFLDDPLGARYWPCTWPRQGEVSSADIAVRQALPTVDPEQAGN
jgi:FG-GAP repeat protein